MLRPIFLKTIDHRQILPKVRSMYSVKHVTDKSCSIVSSNIWGCVIYTSATCIQVYTVGYWPCMVKSLLDRGFWLEVAELKNARHLRKKRSPTMISPYTVSNHFIAYFDSVITWFMYFKLLQISNSRQMGGTIS